MSLGHSYHGKSRRGRLGYAISCVQSQLITDHQGTYDQCAMMISVAPAVPAVSVHQCYISAHLRSLSVSPISASQCHLSVLPISATY
ncbi:unnamed protein product [Staurois parvus]|uniref:Uncharacterized protein n=1 Tax=Staurois parvus TaxID=386267 RepID=A0ABN9ACD0_9NEOB|nr:unnamed protein product [Staurois parvus]